MTRKKSCRPSLQQTTNNKQQTTNNKQQRHYYSLVTLFLGLLLAACNPPGSETAKNTEAKIIEWTFAKYPGTPTLDHANRTIQVNVPWLLKKNQLTASSKLSDGASITPDPETARDYTSPVKFTVTAEDGTKKTYTVSVAFLPNLSTISFQKDGKEFADLTTFNSRDNLTVTVSAGNIPSSLESRVETKVKLLHSNTLLKEGKAATLGDNPPVTTPKSLAAFPTVSQPTRSKAAQDTKSLVLDTTKDSGGNVLSALYLIEAKVFVRFSGTKEEWIEAKTEHRQYARYFLSTDGDKTVNDMLEITYNKFIVAKGSEVTLTIKKKDNDMSRYKHIEFQLQQLKGGFVVSFYIKMPTQKVLKMGTANGITLAQKRFDTKSIVEDYKYERGKYQITLKGLKVKTLLRLSLVDLHGSPVATFELPFILVTE